MWVYAKTGNGINQSKGEHMKVRQQGKRRAKLWRERNAFTWAVRKTMLQIAKASMRMSAALAEAYRKGLEARGNT
jgi:hypothetical protein